ncbi:uncharacterized protein LOC111404621 [Olea europaea var. sylvestris]|uniref:uncharacterized protein LOC111404621 n=1 Tax=Olea europaea var. sylvestris TaxID=158386 RepID=UPI000C1CFD20|nr:uncharacterized protein LOC111404621 [Olea europaea var. sylvestris]
MESLCPNLDLKAAYLSSIPKSFTEPTSKLFFSVLNCRKPQKFRVKLTQAVNERKSSGQFSHGCNENLVKWVGRGVLGFALSVSLCCDSPAFAETLTVAFPVSHTLEVNTVQRTLVEAWGLIRETFIDPTFNHQGPNRFSPFGLLLYSTSKKEKKKKKKRNFLIFF